MLSKIKIGAVTRKITSLVTTVLAELDIQYKRMNSWTDKKINKYIYCNVHWVSNTWNKI